MHRVYCVARGRFFPVATSAAPPFLNLGDPLCRAVKPALSPFRHSRHHCFDYQFHFMSCCLSNRAIGQCWCWESGGNLVFWERQTFVNLCRPAFWPQEPQNGKHTTQDLEKATNTKHNTTSYRERQTQHQHNTEQYTKVQKHTTPHGETQTKHRRPSPPLTGVTVPCLRQHQSREC